MKTLILIRHGESEWNKDNKFTGWADPSLTEEGRQGSYAAGMLLKHHNYNIEKMFSSALKRSCETSLCLMKGYGSYFPIQLSWRLNERHYGGLTGMNKDQARLVYGEEKILYWRRSCLGVPPPTNSHKDFLCAYRHIPDCYTPLSESLFDAYERFLPFWNGFIARYYSKHKNVYCISTHTNIIRSIIIKELNMNINSHEISYLNIPVTNPIVMEYDACNLKSIFYLDEKRKDFLPSIS